MSVVKDTLILGLSRVLSVVLNFVSLNIVLGVIGQDGYGFWSFCLLVAAYVGLIDIGFLDGFQRIITQRSGAGNTEGTHSAAKTHRRYVAWIIPAGALVCLLMGFVFDTGFKFAPGTYHVVFAYAAAVFVSQTLVAHGAAYLFGRKQFQQYAKAQSVSTLVTSITTAGMTVIFRTPEAFTITTVLCSTGTAAWMFAYAVREMRREQTNPPLDREALKESGKFALKNYLNKLGVMFAANGDRTAIANRLNNQEALGSYSVGSRIAETVAAGLPFNVVMAPELVKAHQDGPVPFARLIHRMSLASLLLGLTFVVMPIAFLGALRPIVLPSASEIVVPIALAMALYRGIDQFYTALGGAAYWSGSPEKIVPFTLYNGLATLLAAPWVVTQYGIVGVAWMNVVIQLVQLFPLTWFIKRFIAPEIDYWGWMARVFLIMALCGSVGFGCYEMASLPIFQRVPALALLPAALIPLAVVLFCDRVKLVELPEGVKKKLAKIGIK